MGRERERERERERFFCLFCVQVETFGSMEKDEKVRFILEQMRLCLAKKDYIRTQIISKKISIKYFASEADLVQVCSASISPYLISPSLQELKLKYYKLMIELCQHEQNYLATCKHYRAIFDTPQVQSDESLWKEVRREGGRGDRWERVREILPILQALKNATLYVLLAPFDNEQSDLLHRVYQEKKLQDLNVYK